ncbi:MAG: hypothetical protein DRP83_08100, partial [Planctomycetota bacterium]
MLALCNLFIEVSVAIGIAFLSPIIFFHQPDVTKLKSNSVDKLNARLAADLRARSAVRCSDGLGGCRLSHDLMLPPENY